MSNVNYEVSNRIGVLTLNRPEKKNALNASMVADLTNALSKAENDDQVKVIIIKARGDVFCSGADLESLQQLQNNSPEENLKDSQLLKELFLKIYTLSKIVIAEVQGHALAGGCGLATVCDFVYAVPEAKLGYTEVKIGFVPAIVMVFLIRKVGEQKAKYLLLSGQLVMGDEAKSLGLIDQVVEKGQLSISVRQWAEHLVNSNSSQSMALTKKMIAEVQSFSLEDGLNYAAKMNAQARSSEDCKRGIAAFLNKEKILW